MLVASSNANNSLCAEILCVCDEPKPIPFLNHTSDVFYSLWRGTDAFNFPELLEMLY